ncbi:hypothetical protein RSAG8_00458, partial [Rhizoctonia solani AG-8 WAC10335]
MGRAKSSEWCKKIVMRAIQKHIWPCREETYRPSRLGSSTAVCYVRYRAQIIIVQAIGKDYREPGRLSRDSRPASSPGKCTI